MRFRLEWLLSIFALCLAGSADAQGIEVRWRPQRTPGDQPTHAEADLQQVAKLLVEKTNAFRLQQGRPALSVSRELSKAAHDFAGFMADGDKYGHTADDREPAERVVAAGYDYCIVDENIAWLFHTNGFTTEELAQDLFQGWQHSPEHRQNLLDPDLLEIGVAVSKSAKTGRYYGVQEFGRPRSAQIDFEVFNSTDQELAYRVDGKRFTLEPRYRRQHQRCVPPALEIAGSGDHAGDEITFQPSAGDRYIARRDSGNRVVVQKVHSDPKEATAGGRTNGRRD